MALAPQFPDTLMLGERLSMIIASYVPSSVHDV